MVRRRIQPGDGQFVGLVVEHDGDVIGDSMVSLQGTGLSEGEIGWTIRPQHAGRGYATEAARAVLGLGFEHYGLRRIVANLDTRNDRSPALCERLGMRHEIHRRGDFWSKGPGPTPTSTLSSGRSGAGSPDPPHVRAGCGGRGRTTGSGQPSCDAVRSQDSLPANVRPSTPA